LIIKPYSNARYVLYTVLSRFGSTMVNWQSSTSSTRYVVSSKSLDRTTPTQKIHHSSTKTG
jgi:hypothetical protein